MMKSTELAVMGGRHCLIIDSFVPRRHQKLPQNHQLHWTFWSRQPKCTNKSQTRSNTNCETQPPASIGWVALSVRIWSWQRVSDIFSAIYLQSEFCIVYCCLFSPPHAFANHTKFGWKIDRKLGKWNKLGSFNSPPPPPHNEGNGQKRGGSLLWNVTPWPSFNWTPKRMGMS